MEKILERKFVEYEVLLYLKLAETQKYRHAFYNQEPLEFNELGLEQGKYIITKTELLMDDDCEQGSCKLVISLRKENTRKV